MFTTPVYTEIKPTCAVLIHCFSNSNIVEKRLVQEANKAVQPQSNLNELQFSYALYPGSITIKFLSLASGNNTFRLINFSSLCRERCIYIAQKTEEDNVHNVCELILYYIISQVRS